MEKQSRIKEYLQECHPEGCTVRDATDFKRTQLLFEVRDADGRRMGFVSLAEEFVDDYWDVLEQELDSRDVIGTMQRVGEKKQVIVTKTGTVVENLTEGKGA